MRGEIDVHEKITVFKKGGLFSSKLKPVEIPVGKYKTTLKASSKKKFKLTIKDVNGKSVKVPFVIPAGTKVPETEGTLLLSSAETKQPYDLAIAVSTKVSGHTYTTTESCVSHYEYDTVCRWVSASESCHTEGGDEVCRTKPSGQQVCFTTSSRQVCSTEPGYEDCREESTPVYGSEEVTYDETTSTRNVIAEFKDGDIIKAVFDHAKTKSNRDRIGSGPCY
ncbi:MAG: hypothetical protein HOM21_12845 [Halobacteriovoraceae bacterium]|jgi:hypothetical protein|nr:hypothetical protein [Halobacteriovoraceae bacterium]